MILKVSSSPLQTTLSFPADTTFPLPLTGAAKNLTLFFSATSRIF